MTHYFIDTSGLVHCGGNNTMVCRQALNLFCGRKLYGYLRQAVLVKRYINEAGTAWVQALHDPLADHTRWLVRLAAVECIAAISRRTRMGQVALADVQTLRARFRADVTTDYRIVEVTPQLTERAMDLAEHFPLRAYDAIQLAAADLVNAEFVKLRHPAITFVSADGVLNSAAHQLGLVVEDPSMH